jgi:DNA-binding NtrC family response regulator
MIHFKNAENGGSCFFFSLPLSMELTDKQKNKKIFLIDDDEDLRDVLSWALNAEGYHIESFDNPSSALEFLSQTKEIPGMILSDYQMSQMKSADLMESREKFHISNVPLLFLTAAPNVVKEEVDRAFYSEIITKPLDLESLILKVNKYIETPLKS